MIIVYLWKEIGVLGAVVVAQNVYMEALVWLWRGILDICFCCSRAHIRLINNGNNFW